MYFDWRYIVGYSWFANLSVDSLCPLGLTSLIQGAVTAAGLNWTEMNWATFQWTFLFTAAASFFEQLRFLTLAFFVMLSFFILISSFLYFSFLYFFISLLLYLLFLFFLYFIYFFIYNEHTILKCTVKREESCTIKGYTKTHKIPIFCCFGSVLSMLSVSQILRTRKISTHIVLYRDLIFLTQ